MKGYYFRDHCFRSQMVTLINLFKLGNSDNTKFSKDQAILTMITVFRNFFFFSFIEKVIAASAVT